MQTAIQVLNPKYKGRPIFDYDTAGSRVQIHPHLEKIQAARWAGYRPTEFFDLEPDWIAMIVGAYRTDKKIEAVLQTEQNKKARAEARAQKSKGTSKGGGGKR